MGEEKILKELKEIKKDIKFIKDILIDSDTVLTESDKLAIKQAKKEYARGETTSLEELEKELGY